MVEESGLSKCHTDLPRQRAPTKGKGKQTTKWWKAAFCKSGEGHTIASNFATHLMNPDQLLLKCRLAEGEKENGGPTQPGLKPAETWEWPCSCMGPTATPRSRISSHQSMGLIEKLLHEATVEYLLWIHQIKNRSLRDNWIPNFFRP